MRVRLHVALQAADAKLRSASRALSTKSRHSAPGPISAVRLKCSQCPLTARFEANQAASPLALPVPPL